MKKRLYVFAILALMLCAVFAFCERKTYAASTLVPYAWISGDSGIDSDGGTTFYIGITYGGSCSDEDCSQYGSFRCTEAGDNFTTCIDDDKTTVTYSFSDSNYDYYYVRFYPCNSSQQNIGGYIKRLKKTLTASGKIVGDTENVVWSNIDSSKVSKGSSASVTVDNGKTKDGKEYEFAYWGSSCPESSRDGRSCTINPLNSDREVYAYYRLKQRTFTAYAAVNGTYDAGTDTRTYIKSDGSTTASRDDGWKRQATVNYGSSATVDTSSFNPTGYSWNSWGSSCSNSERDGRKCTRSSLTSNDNVYAYYDRNHFKGQARVFEGDSASGNAKASTGYVDSDSTRNADMECVNNGCKATYDLYLRTIAGSGKTNFSSNASSLLHSSPYAPSTSGTKIKEITKTLYPGGSACYYITFRPYGSLSNTATKTAKACMSAKVSTFEGRTRVSGAAVKADGYRNTTSSEGDQLVTINNCSPVDGCKVSFEHSLKRTAGIGSTNWVVERTSNLTSSSSDRAVSDAEGDAALGRGTFSAAEQVVKTDGEITLYPGMVVCEKLTFKPSNDTTQTINNVYTRVCVSALGNAQPGDPNPDTPEDPNNLSGDTSFINIKVRNADVEKYGSYQRVVYAKPGDHISWRATYNPVLQYTYFLKPEKMSIDGGSVYDNSGSFMGALFNAKNGCNTNNNNVIRCWNNAFGLKSNFSSYSKYNYAKRYTLGNNSKRVEQLEDYIVGDWNVGNSLEETAATNTANTAKEDGNALSSTNPLQSDQVTSRQVTFSNNNNKNWGDVITESVSKIAAVKVPYNFRTGVEIRTDESKIFYAGEDGSVDFKISVLEKTNSETTDGSQDQAYATSMSGAKVRTIIYFGDKKGEQENYGNSGSDLCNYYGKSNDNVNCGYATTKDDETFTADDNNKSTSNSRFNIPDVSAGSKICAAVAVYPSSSGSDTNLDPNGSGTWHISASKCFTIAKRPSFQVWGGSVYSAGKVEVPASRKNNLAGLWGYSYAISGSNEHRVFGSWAELGLVAGGAVTGLASGAGTGYDGLGFSANPGGSAEGTSTNYCLRSTLSFANSGCNGEGSVGGLGGTSSDSSKASLISRFTVGSGDTYDLDSVVGNREIEAMEGFSGVTVGEGVEQKTKTTKVIAASGDITIKGNITYWDGSYSELESIPKIIIYGNSIKIDCSVTRVDAVLIAEKNIDTCETPEGNYNRLDNSVPLIINGSTISDTLNLNRTYGAATGANSIEPAEIINYDTSLFLWANKQADATTSGKLTETYVRELAPRY